MTVLDIIEQAYTWCAAHVKSTQAEKALASEPFTAEMLRRGDVDVPTVAFYSAFYLGLLLAVDACLESGLVVNLTSTLTVRAQCIAVQYALIAMLDGGQDGSYQRRMLSVMLGEAAPRDEQEGKDLLMLFFSVLGAVLTVKWHLGKEESIDVEYLIEHNLLDPIETALRS